jgi:predicted metal-dependent hydrolase
MNGRGKRRTPDNVKVNFRKMRFGFERKGVDRHWHDNSPFISYFWAALSSAFPPGELFFMNSARALRDRVDDERLQAEIDQFLLQEGHHTLQHRKFNRVVGEQGFDVERYEQRFARALGLAEKHLSPMGRLSVTVALEHFTAGLAHQYLDNPVIARGADPEVRALWAWHSAEESEHKSTCFDLYIQLGGDYRSRVATLPISWALIVAITLRNLFDMLREDRRLLDLEDNLRGLRYLFGSRGLFSSMAPAFFRYFRREFHPWDHDDSLLIAAWEKANAGYIVNTPTAASA